MIRRILLALILWSVCLVGVAIAKEPELQFKSDRQVKEISNLRHVESASDYIDRKIETLEEQVRSLQASLVESSGQASDGKGTVEERLTQLEKALLTLREKVERMNAVLANAPIAEDLAEQKREITREDLDREVDRLNEKIKALELKAEQAAAGAMPTEPKESPE